MLTHALNSTKDAVLDMQQDNRNHRNRSQYIIYRHMKQNETDDAMDLPYLQSCCVFKTSNEMVNNGGKYVPQRLLTKKAWLSNLIIWPYHYVNFLFHPDPAPQISVSPVMSEVRPSIGVGSGWNRKLPWWACDKSAEQVACIMKT